MKSHIQGLIEDLALDFAVYNRSEDEDLTQEDLCESIKNGTISYDEMGEWFSNAVKKHLKIDAQTCTIVGADVMGHFSLKVLTAELPAKAKDIWNNPDNYEKTGDSWYDFLKYLWIEFPDKSEKSFADYCKEQGIF